MDSPLGLLIDNKLLLLSKIQEDLRQFVRCIIIKVYRLCEAALQSWVRVDEVVHLVSIARHDTNELTPIVFQALQQGVDCF